MQHPGWHVAGPTTKKDSALHASQPLFRIRRPALSVALAFAAASSLGGCSWLHFGENQDTYDYRKVQVRNLPLEVPPDLSQLPKDDQYVIPAATSSASTKPAASAPAGGTAPVVNAAVVAQTTPAGVVVAGASGNARILRDGSERWLNVSVTPELAYSTLRDLWVSQGFKIVRDEPALGLLETDWNESHPVVTEDGIRNLLHKALGAFDSAGERTRYRAQFERNPDGSTDVMITQRGMVEILQGLNHETSKWQVAPSSPDLELEQLQRLKLRLMPQQAVAVASVTSTSSTAVAPAAVSVVKAEPAAASTTMASDLAHKVSVDGVLTVQLEDTPERAWRRVGVALDRLGFTIEDRLRDKHAYTVRYLDPDYEAAEREKRSWWNRVFNAEAPVPEQQFRISLTQKNNLVIVQVQDKDGHADTSATARHIVDQLYDQLH
jgi:outer membrane protein assembly factor BamC